MDVTNGANNVYGTHAHAFTYAYVIDKRNDWSPPFITPSSNIRGKIISTVLVITHMCVHIIITAINVIQNKLRHFVDYKLSCFFPFFSRELCVIFFIVLIVCANIHAR